MTQSKKTRRVARGGNPRNQIGTIFLLFAAVGFCVVNFIPMLGLDHVVFFAGYSLKRLLSSFFDASLVGALADWFAVTALFRNPLGIPLPHTNLLAKSKDSMAEALPRFLAGFIKPESIRTELEQTDFSSILEKTLSDPQIRSQVHEFIHKRLATDPESIAEANPAELVQLLLELAADNFDAPDACATLITWARKETFDDRLIEGGAALIQREIERNREPLVEFLTPRIKKASGWQGLFIGNGTVDKALHGIIEELSSIRREPNHDLRRFIRSAVDSWAFFLGKPGTIRDQFALFISDTLKNRVFQERVTAFAREMVQHVGNDFSSPESRLPAVLNRIEDVFITRLGTDPAFRARFNKGLVDLLSDLIVKSNLIENAVDYLVQQLKRTDTKEFVDRVENSVWNDLQYIRVNGAVVGGLAGIALSLLSLLFPT